MKELLRERDMIRIKYYQNLLEANGISTIVKNEIIAGVEGYAIPAYLPILCVFDDSREGEAMSLIKADIKQSAEASTEEAPCPNCHELNPSNFGTCWSCQAELTD